MAGNLSELTHPSDAALIRQMFKFSYDLRLYAYIAAVQIIKTTGQTLTKVGCCALCLHVSRRTSLRRTSTTSSMN